MSLLTPEIMAWVGRTITFASDPISISEARRFIAASGDDNPLYAIEQEAGDDTAAPVPPMLYYGATRPLVPASAMAEDGTVHEHRPMVGTGQTMGGSVEMEWLRPLQTGDRLSGVRTLKSLTEKQGKTRRFVIAEWETEYRDQAGRLAVRERYEQLLF